MWLFREKTLFSIFHKLLVLHPGLSFLPTKQTYSCEEWGGERMLKYLFQESGNQVTLSGEYSENK